MGDNCANFMGDDRDDLTMATTPTSAQNGFNGLSSMLCSSGATGVPGIQRCTSNLSQASYPDGMASVRRHGGVGECGEVNGSAAAAAG